VHILVRYSPACSPRLALALIAAKVVVVEVFAAWLSRLGDPRRHSHVAPAVAMERPAVLVTIVIVAAVG
jgi:hypothetical protein